MFRTSAKDAFMFQTIPMTSAGLSALREEMKHRTHARPRIAERLQQAISGDVNLAENSEYQSALEEQAVNENRIAELEDKLARAEVIDLAKQAGDVIRFGATVTVIDEDSRRKNTWQIVGEPEADARRGRISVTSPIGRALIGKNRGDSVEVNVPAGIRSYKVHNVEWADGRKRS
jgi:transcription elongation factor GreA